MTALLANNATSTLASAITDTDTTVVLATSDGASFPSPTGDEWFPLTLQNSSSMEIVRVTARSGDSLQVVRAQEGTTAQAFSVGDSAKLRFTEAVHSSYGQAADIALAVNDHVALPDPHTQYEPRLSANVVWDSVSDDYSREHVTSGVTPIHEAMRRCVVRDDKTVAYYLDPNDSNLKADGAASDLTGTDGQVMVEIPKYYVRISRLLNGKYKREISEVHQSGFVVHPAFAIGGTLQYDQSVGMWHYFGNTDEKRASSSSASEINICPSNCSHGYGLGRTRQFN